MEKIEIMVINSGCPRTQTVIHFENIDLYE